MTDKEQKLRTALLVLLDCVDYTAGACRLTEQVGAVLPTNALALAKAALQ